jgi:hypothetical protein
MLLNLPPISYQVIICCVILLGVILEKKRQQIVDEKIKEAWKDARVIREYGDYVMVAHHVGPNDEPLSTFTSYREDFHRHLTDAFQKIYSHPFELGQKLVITLEPNPHKIPGKEWTGIPYEEKTPNLNATRCPNCAGRLVKRENHGQGCKTCESCNSIWFVLYLKKEHEQT